MRYQKNGQELGEGKETKNEAIKKMPYHEKTMIQHLFYLFLVPVYNQIQFSC